jgi:hypothetical protein
MTHDCIIGCDFINLPDMMLLNIGASVWVRSLGDVKQVQELESCEIKENNKLEPTVGNIDERARSKCSELLEEFGDRIPKSTTDLGKTTATSS